MTNEEAHRLAREKGVSRPVYWIVRAIVVPFVRLWFRLRVTGREHVPAEGAAIVAPNHKSFFDSFFIAVCTKRHLRFMGKSELFEGRRGRLLIALGAFPVRRGQSDADAIETAREILRQGGLLALFPEGTRVRDPDELGDPKKGAGRLALEMGVPLVPCAISGTEKLFAGPFPKPRRVQVAFAAPIEVKELAATPDEAGELVENTLWPEVEREFQGLRAHPGLIAAGIAALGVGGAAAYRSRARKRSRTRNPFKR